MPTIAPLVAAWKRRARNLPGPLAGTGEVSNGAPVTVEMLIGGVWTDITAYVMVRDDQGQINLSWGIRDEGNTTEQAAGTLPLKNQDGRFSMRNPMGAYFGLIGRNQPIRISVPDGLGGKTYRTWAEVPTWPVSWEPSGNDVWVDVSVAGPLQRYAKAPPPERSVVYNAVTSPLSPNVVAYWPCEDPSGATSLASGIATGSAMTWSGVPTLASYGGFAASDPLPDITAATLSGAVPAYADPTATQVRFLVYIPKAGLADGKIVCAFDQVDYSAGSAQFWELFYSTSDANNSLVLRTCASDGTVLGAELVHTLDVRGRLLYVSVELQESGTGVTRQLQLKDVSTSRVYAVSDTETLTSLTRVTKVQFGPAARAVSGPAGSAVLPGVAVGHATVETAITAIDALGIRLNPIGETAGRRIQRLCGENGIAVDWIGDLDDTVPMGAQGKSNPLALIQECVLADGGMLYETTDALGLGYRTRASLYNQDAALTLDYPSGQLAVVPIPVEDDRYLANRVVVSVNGVTATYEDTTSDLSTQPPPAGVGVYGANSSSPLDLNLATSDTPTLLDQAAWHVHLGTVDEARFPTIGVNLAHPSITPDMRRAILALRIGDRIQITNPPVWLPPDTIDQLILGCAESITHFEHRLTFTCQPASPYSYIGYLDATARIDTDGTQLLTAIGSGDTAVDVVPTSDMSMIWTTDPADMPFDVRAGGEVMRVAAASPKISDTFTRVTANGWGTADTGQAWSTSGGAAADYSTSGTQGLMSMTSVNVSRYCVTPAPAADVDLRVEASTSVLATGGPHYVHLAARYADASNMYVARLAFNTDQTLAITLQKRVAGTQTDLVSVTVPGTHAANTMFAFRFQMQGAVLRARSWAVATEAEPGVWYATAADTSLSDPGSVGVRSVLSSLNTNTLPVTVAYDNWRLVNVQTFTVTRSIDTVVKAHAVGEDLRLAHPTYLAL
jgi:hypothetical protein